MTDKMYVEVRLVDRVTPQLRRSRWLLLTPIGRRVPPRGTYARAMLELQVHLRRAGRALWAALPGGHAVPYPDAARRMYRWAVLAGLVWWLTLGALLALHALGIVR